MADGLLRSKHGFGSLEGVELAKADGKLDAYDILYLDGATDPKIGWIDKDGNTVIVDHHDIIVIDVLPKLGATGKLYIVGSRCYIWANDSFIPLVGDTTGVIGEIDSLKEENALLNKEVENLAEAVKALESNNVTFVELE